MKLFCLGNEFIENDSFAKKLAKILKKDHDIIEINDSFKLMSKLNEVNEAIILDVVKGISEPELLDPGDLKISSIMSAHDFDASYIINLFKETKKIRIIGIPMFGEFEIIKEKVKILLNKNL